MNLLVGRARRARRRSNIPPHSARSASAPYLQRLVQGHNAPQNGRAGSV